MSLLLVSDSSALSQPRRPRTSLPESLVDKQEATLQRYDEIQILSQDPLAYLIPNLLSPDECEAYRNRVSDRTMTISNPPEVSLDATKLWPLPFLSLLAGVPPALRLEAPDLSTLLQAATPNVVLALTASFLLAFGVVLPAMRAVSNQSSRTSVAVALNEEADVDFIRPLMDRLEDRTTHSWDCWEAPVVTRYEPGAIFARHGDASPTRGSEWTDLGGQRVITCICYLNTVQNGGETAFDTFRVQPRQGSALIFFPADSVTMKADERTLHESMPTIDEDKWIVQVFGRSQRVPPPLGIPDKLAMTSS